MRKRRGKRENQLVSDEEKMETRGRCRQRHKYKNGVIKKIVSVLQPNKHLHTNTYRVTSGYVEGDLGRTLPFVSPSTWPPWKQRIDGFEKKTCLKSSRGKTREG